MIRKMFNIVPHDPDEGLHGDCYRNCIAMLMGMDQNDVPHFYHDGDGRLGAQRISEFLNDRGFTMADIPFGPHESVESILLFSKKLIPKSVCILSGKSRKEINHSVVVIDGEIWCDPSGSGIIGPMIGDEGDMFYYLSFLTPLLGEYETEDPPVEDE